MTGFLVKVPFWNISEMYYVTENYPVCRNSQNCNSFWSKKCWIYSTNTNYALIATKSQTRLLLKKLGQKVQTFWTFLLLFRLTIIFSSAYLAQLGSSMATKRSSRRDRTDSSKPLFPSNCFICGNTRIQKNKNDIADKKILILLAEATMKTAAKGKLYDFYFQSKDLDLIAHEVLCHQPYYKSFIPGCSCSFQKVSPMINFKEALNHPFYCPLKPVQC